MNTKPPCYQQIIDLFQLIRFEQTTSDTTAALLLLAMVQWQSNLDARQKWEVEHAND